MNEAKLNEMSIEELRESLEEQMNYSYDLKKEINELDATIIKLENNWNELKEFVKTEYYDGYIYSSTIIKKMQEIESRK